MATRTAAKAAANAAARAAAGTAAATPQACVSAPLKPGWQYATTAWGTGAGALSALTGLGGAVVFIPACSRLGMTAKKIVGTTVVAVTCATTAGSYAYTQNNVTDIPAAFAIGAVGACTTPIGQRIARGVSGKTLRRWCGAALLACAPTAFMKKEKPGDTTVDEDHSPGGISEVRPGGAAALALAGKADELVARGGILSYLKSRGADAEPDATEAKETKTKSGAKSAAKAKVAAHSVAETRGGAGKGDEEAAAATVAEGESGSAWINFQEQFAARVEAAGGWKEALWAEREHLGLGVAVGLLQGTVGVGGGVLVTTYMSIMSDMEVHRICATALCATLVTNTAVCTHHFIQGNVRLRVAAVLGASAMAASYVTAKNVSLAVPEPVIRGFIACALVASGVSMFK